MDSQLTQCLLCNNMSFLLWFAISPPSSINFPYICKLFLGFLLLFHLAFCASTVLNIIAYNKCGLLVGRVLFQDWHFTVECLSLSSFIKSATDLNCMEFYIDELTFYNTEFSHVWKWMIVLSIRGHLYLSVLFKKFLCKI